MSENIHAKRFWYLHLTLFTVYNFILSKTRINSHTIFQTNTSDRHLSLHRIESTENFLTQI